MILCDRIIALCICIIFGCGCTMSDRYLITQPTATTLAQTSDLQNLAVPATTKKGKPVFVRGSTIDLQSAKPSGAGVEVVARAPSKFVLAGSLLTWIGTAISVTGTVLFIAYHSGDPYWAGIGMAVSAEAVMWTGTGLWIYGAGHNPQEVPPGRADLRYSNP
jgi:hypothetical protein